MISTSQCAKVADCMCDYVEGALDPAEREAVERHVAACAHCRQSLRNFKGVQKLLQGTVGASQLSPDFVAKTSQKLRAITASHRPELRSMLPEREAEQPVQEGWHSRMSGAPWWGVSLALHVLAIALAGLISMAVELPRTDESVVMVTELVPRKEVKVEEEEKKPETENRNALESKQEVPPTDPTSKDLSDIIVPPEILAKAELGDHFETINLDRPDTQSAFGNPDAKMFHSVQGNDEPEGGGGMGGIGGLDDMIGVGGNASPGSGGGWGGGHGTGIGVGNGAGRGSFGNRNGGGRRLMVKRHGGNPATENAVDRALDWLARHQEADGRWSTRKTESAHDWDPGVTGLATLAFLGAGHTEKVGKYKENVKRAITWILSQQRDDGAIGSNPMWTDHGGGYGYHHSICGLALAEAAGMARVPETTKAAQKAVNYSCEKHQWGEGSDKLGWRYQPKAAKGDISNVGWFVMQLKSAKVAGLAVDWASIEGAIKFVASCEEPAANIKKEDEGYDNGRHRYKYMPDTTYGPSETAIGVLCRLFTGTKPEECRGSGMWLVKHDTPAWRKDLGPAFNGHTMPFYYTYYGTLCLFQLGGDDWKKWNEGLQAMLLPNQRKDGDFAGSWDPFSDIDIWAGRAYTTALGALSLEVYYRYAKLGPDK